MLQLIYWLCFLSLATAPMQEAPVELQTLQGSMATVEDPEVPRIRARFWAKGDNLRVESSLGQLTGVTIQKGSVVYTFIEGGNEEAGYAKKGRKMVYADGLASKGLLEQIKMVLEVGRKVNTKEVDGQSFSTFVYDVDFPRDVALVVFSDRTMLPQMWVTFPEKSENGRPPMPIVFSEMEPNAEIDNSRFELPRDVQFLEEEPVPLASGIPVPSTPAKPNIESSESEDQLFCVYSVTKYRVNDDVRSVLERSEFSFYLDSNGYSVESTPFADASVGLRVVYDRPRQMVLEIRPGEKEYVEYPIISQVQFKVLEFPHRVGLCKGLEAAGLPKILACTRVELESALGYSRPQFFERRSEPSLKAFRRGEEYLFANDGIVFSRFVSSDISLSKQLTRSLKNLIAHRISLHPLVRQEIEATGKLPQSFLVSYKEFGPDGSVANCQLEYDLKSTDDQRNDAWNIVPSDFVESDAQLTPEVVNLNRRFADLIVPPPQDLMRTSRERIEMLMDSRKECAALIAALRYLEITGDWEGGRSLVKLVQQRDNQLVEKYLSGRMEEADFRELVNVVSEEDRSLKPMADYLFVDTGMAEKWDIDAHGRLLEILKEDPFVVGAYLDLGRIMVQKFEMPSAWKCWEMGASLNPNHGGLRTIQESKSAMMRDFPDHF